MVRQAAQRVSQLPHAERVAKERIFASHYHPELRQGEGKLESASFSPTVIRPIHLHLTLQKPEHLSCDVICDVSSTLAR